VRHLRGDADGALADYRQAITRNADEPMLWANLGTVALHHNRLKEAEEARAKLAAWPGLFVAAWHVAEAQRGDEEGAPDRAAWRRKHLAR
jgi:hypothetical protein